MKVRILRTYGSLKKDSIHEVDQKTYDFLLNNQIACIVPDDECHGECDECEDCKGKNKKATTKKPSAKKKVTKKTASK